MILNSMDMKVISTILRAIDYILVEIVGLFKRCLMGSLINQTLPINIEMWQGFIFMLMDGS